MNNLNVAKFGGTSMMDFTAMNRCANIVLADSSIRVVVVSASSGVTNQLIELSSGECDRPARQAIVNRISEHHRNILSEMGNPAQTLATLEQLLGQLSEAAEQLSRGRTLQLTDQILSFGELLSSTLFSEVIRLREQNCQWFDARTVMITDSYHGSAEPQTEQIACAAQTTLLPLCLQNIVVTQGFIGSDEHGNTTTLGRGGSDYSSALLAESLQAQNLQIWTDVEGVYTTDPRIATKAYAMKEISFCEAAELATFGAKVLHPSTLWPAIRQNINVFVGSSHNPTNGGTWIKQQVDSAPNYRAIAVRTNQTLVTVSSLSMLHTHGFLARVFTILAKHKISVDLITTSEVSVALTLDSVAGHSGGLAQVVIDELSELCEVKVELGLALVAVVGNNIERQAGVSARLFTVLSPSNLRMICFGASSHNICFLVGQEEANDIVCSLHRELFEQES
jgi:aspartate kinase